MSRILSAPSRAVTRRELLKLLGLGAAVPIIAACEAAPPAAPATGATSSKASTAPAGKITVALSADIDQYDPQKLSASTEYFVNANLYESLYGRDLQGKLVPALATSYEVRDGGQTYDFTLRRGVTFHNGDTFTSKDVKFSFDRAVNPATKYTFAGQLANVAAVETPAEDHVVFKLKALDSSFLPVLSWYFLVAPSAYLQRVGDDGFREQPVGTGPYKFVERKVKQSIRIESFTSHWRKAPAVQTIVFRPVPDASSRVAMLQTGEVDIAVNLPPLLEKQITGTARLRTLSAPTDVIVGIALDTVTRRNSPLTDRRVRQAMNYAVDKQGIVDRLLGGHATPLYAPIIPTMLGWDSSMRPYPYDPAKAKALLAEAGHGSGFEASISVPAGRYTQGEQVVEAVAGYLTEVGIRTTVVKLDSAAWLAKLRARDIYPMSLLGRGDSTGDPNGRLMNGVHSSAPFSFYANPSVDSMIRQGIGVTDQSARDALYRRLYGVLHDEAIEIYLYEEHSIFGLRDNVNWQPAPGEQFTKMWEATLR